MDNLDEKLGDALEAITCDGNFQSAREFVIYITETPDLEHYENPMMERVEKAKSAIKQAFIDAGYFKPGELAPYYTEMIKAYIKAGGSSDCVLMSRNDWEVNARLSGLMTGQEWYERFLREMPLPFSLDGPQEAVDYYDVKLAAKKAAGMS